MMEGVKVGTEEFFRQKLQEAKTHFERALDCKHTEFDDLYPYMIEHPQFFWYKRYVAWSELLTIVRLCEELGIPWTEHFTPRQIEYVRKRVMSGTVLDEWYETNESQSREHVGWRRKAYMAKGPAQDKRLARARVFRK